ncbi:hypothetical protein EI74_0377 [Mycoplasma testudineum]|uniref:Uncharacterized protein n=1 Tax=Mycoplasma testudineum TaxID=244584 RepID=A0A4R6IFP2_9MOLU|nr:hypothetical protein [Mycoplasma testudineum]OYD26993.1 hypothetical protein CG473_01510 [Mycoplasma testudineum]TDO20541.1 hypothetical protein EI74_0377 [Mycoplasma testudineum]
MVKKFEKIFNLMATFIFEIYCSNAKVYASSNSKKNNKETVEFIAPTDGYYSVDIIAQKKNLKSYAVEGYYSYFLN